MANQKEIGIAILGIAAVLAIIGLVLMFSTAMKSGAFSATLPKVYGGALRNQAYPYLQDRSVTGIEGDQYAAQATDTNMKYGRSVRNIPTEYTTCGEGRIRVDYAQMQHMVNQGSVCSKFAAGYCCNFIGA